MAINPNLVSIIPASELPTGEPTSAGQFFFFEGNEMKKAPMTNIYDKVTSGIKGTATQANAPTVYTVETFPNGLFERYIVSAPITSPNSWGNIAVTQAELNANFVFFNVKNGVVTKEVSAKIAGRGVASIAKTSTVGDVDTYTVTYSDATTSTFNITNGNTAKLPLYSAIKSANIAAGVQFIDDENGNVTYRVKTGQTLLTSETPAGTVGTKVEIVGGQDITPYKNAQFIKMGKNLFDKTKVTTGFFVGGGNLIANAQYTASDWIDITGVAKLYMSHPDQISYYTKNKVYISAQQDTNILTAPANAAYIRASVKIINLDAFQLEIGEVGTAYERFSYYLQNEKVVDHELLGRVSVNEANLLSANRGLSLDRNKNAGFGALDFQTLSATGLNHFVTYGQSLSMGWQGKQALTTTPMAGLYMLGNMIWGTERGNNSTNTVSPLISTISGDNNAAEAPIISAMHHFKTLLNARGRNIGDIIASSTGSPGTTIEQLSKEHYLNATNLYNVRFISTLNRAKTFADSQSKEIKCPAIIWMQGEWNYQSFAGTGLTNGSVNTLDKDAYKALLLTLKNNMQADVMSIYGQTKKPLFMIYQVSGAYIKIKELPINMALLEFADENDDVMLMNAVYQTPHNSTDGHLTSNGYRWYGEEIGKALGDVFIENKRPSVFRPERIENLGTKLRVWLNVPNPPIVVDNYTTNTVSQSGFVIYKDNVAVTISSVSVYDNFIDLQTATNLTGVIEVVYAGVPTVGTGNIRDSQRYSALFTYYDDSASANPPAYITKDSAGNPINGKKYPLQNWLSNFYIKL